MVKCKSFLVRLLHAETLIIYHIHQNIHVEHEIDHPVSYGVVLGRNSNKLATCFRKYRSHHPHRVFEIVADKLVPISKSTQQKLRKSLEEAMVDKFFYEVKERFQPYTLFPIGWSKYLSDEKFSINTLERPSQTSLSAKTSQN